MPAQLLTTRLPPSHCCLPAPPLSPRPLQRRFTLPSTYIRSKAYLFTATARNEQGSSQPSDPAFQYTTCAVSACNRRQVGGCPAGSAARGP